MSLLTTTRATSPLRKKIVRMIQDGKASWKGLTPDQQAAILEYGRAIHAPIRMILVTCPWCHESVEVAEREGQWIETICPNCLEPF